MTLHSIVAVALFVASIDGFRVQNTAAHDSSHDMNVSGSWNGVPWPPPFETDRKYGRQSQKPPGKLPKRLAVQPYTKNNKKWHGMCRPDVKWARWKNYVFSDYYSMYFLSQAGFEEQNCKCCCASHADDSSIKEGELYCVPLSMSKSTYTKMREGCYQIQGPHMAKKKINTHDMDRYWPRALADEDDDWAPDEYADETEYEVKGPPPAVLDRMGKGSFVNPPGMGWKSASIGPHSVTQRKVNHGGSKNVTHGWYDNELQDRVPNYCVKMFNAQTKNAPKV